jgi:hypothetical protein
MLEISTSNQQFVIYQDAVSIICTLIDNKYLNLTSPHPRSDILTTERTVTDMVNAKMTVTKGDK